MKNGALFSQVHITFQAFLYLYLWRKRPPSLIEGLLHFDTSRAAITFLRPRYSRSAMRTWGLMLNCIPFGGNAFLKYQYVGVELQQVKR